MTTSELFELERVLPDEELARAGDRLIGFAERYARLERGLRLFVDTAGLEAWSKDHYGVRLPILDALRDRYPLVIFHGDVGTGKTASAESMAARLAAGQRAESMLFKLSTRVRGGGMVGEMSKLINEAFEVIALEAGKSRTSYLIIDEGDSLTAARNGGQSHHEDKVAVNTLIQKVDDIRRFGGRILVFVCTNRYNALDSAIIRRALVIERFARPEDRQRRELLQRDLEGMGIRPETLEKLVALTGPTGSRPTYTYSDIRTRLLPAALSLAFPERRLTDEDLLMVAQEMSGTPVMEGDVAGA